MKLHHVAIWASDIEALKDFYVKYFDAKSNNLYENKSTGFKSYFLKFGNGAELELMYRQDIPENANDAIVKQYRGIIHLAFVAESIEEVNKKAKQMEADGFMILRGPRVTGDGYYEFETADPENNRLEVIAKLL